jgi:hypothetical protein
MGAIVIAISCSALPSPRRNTTHSRTPPPQESPGFPLRGRKAYVGFTKGPSPIHVAPGVFFWRVIWFASPGQRLGVRDSRKKVRSSSPLFIYSCAFWEVGVPCADCLFAYLGPVVFAPYNRMRSIAPLLTPMVFLRVPHSSSKVSAYQRIDTPIDSKNLGI